MIKLSAGFIMLLKIGLLAGIVAVYLLIPGIREFMLTGISFIKERNFYDLKEFVLTFGVWAPVCSILLMTLQSLIPFVPGLVITVANAWIFGWQYGAVYSWTGALCGALLDFGIARWYGRPVVRHIVSSRYLELVDGYLHKNGVVAILLTRVIPVLPFKVVSFGAGLTAIPVRLFIFTTAAGQTPGIILYSILGQNLMHGTYAILLVTCLLMVIAGFLYYYRDGLEKYFCHLYYDR